MKHTDNSPSDFVWTKPGTCITLRWRQMGWIPPSEQQEYKDKWAKYQALAIQEITTNSVKHI